MPQNPVMVREKESGQPVYMHTVDAAEAMRLGDYEPLPPDAEVSSEQRASAMSRFKTGQATTHPELQTPEEKEATRAQANEDAALLAGLPPGTPVVVQVPSDRPASQAARQAAQRSRENVAHPPAPAAPSSTSPTPSPASTTEAHPPGTTGRRSS